MDFNIDFNLVRSQKLLLIPQLKQALEILEMNSQELFGYIVEQVESNPALEVAPEEKSLFEYSEEDPEAAPPEETSASLSLKDHLLLQLDSLNMDRKTSLIGEYLIDNTDENGYLSVDIGEVAAYFNISTSSVVRVLGTLQSFDPPGICARNLKECLLLQVKQMDDIDERIPLIVENHLDSLASNDAGSVADSMGIGIDEVNCLFNLIRSLEPRPGREFFMNDTMKAPAAEVTVRKINDRFETLINEEAFPDVSICEECRPAFQGDDAGAFARDSLSRAVWLIKCLEQRKNIILRIAERLLTLQPGFFEYGPGKLRMLDTAAFADALDMHETILMKALSGKYLQCHWGSFELKGFFTPS